MNSTKKKSTKKVKSAPKITRKELALLNTPPFDKTPQVDRRVKRAHISPAVMLEFLRKGSKWQCTESDIPQDAQFRGVAHDWQDNTWVVFFSHPSFPEVPETEEAPRISPATFERIP